MSTLSMWFSTRFSKSMTSFSNFGRFLVFTSNNSQCLLWNQYSQSASFGFLTQVFSKSVSLWNIYFALLKIPQMILSCIIASNSKYRHPMRAKILIVVQNIKLKIKFWNKNKIIKSYYLLESNFDPLVLEKFFGHKSVLTLMWFDHSDLGDHLMSG